MLLTLEENEKKGGKKRRGNKRWTGGREGGSEGGEKRCVCSNRCEDDTVWVMARRPLTGVAVSRVFLV